MATIDEDFADYHFFLRPFIPRGGVPLSLRITVVTTQATYKLVKGDTTVYLSSSVSELTTTSTLNDVVDVVNELLSASGTALHKLHPSIHIREATQALEEYDDDDFDDDDDDVDTYDPSLHSLTGRPSTSCKKIETNEEWWQGIKVHGLKGCSVPTPTLAKHIDAVLIDIAVKTEHVKGASSSKKAKVPKPSDWPASLVHVHVKQECCFDPVEGGIRTPSINDVCNFVVPFSLRSGDYGIEFVDEGMTIDTFLTLVYSHILSCSDIKYNISLSSRLYRVPMSGRCGNLEAIETTAALLGAIQSCPLSWIDPSDTDCGSMCNMYISFGLASSTTVPISVDLVNVRKKASTYIEFKRWEAGTKPCESLPATLKRSSSLTYTGTPEEIDSPYSQGGATSLMLAPPAPKPASSSARGLNTNLRLLNVERLLKRLNSNPDSYLYHGVTDLHKTLWSSHLMTKGELTQDIFTNNYDEGPVTAVMIAEKKWDWDWALFIFANQLKNIFPEKGKYPPLGSDNFLRHTSIPKYQEGVSGSSSSDNVNSFHSSIALIANSIGGSKSGARVTTFVNFTRSFDNCLPGKTQFSVSIIIDPNDKILTISALLNTLKDTSRADYNQLLQVGALKGKAVVITYSVVLRADDVLQGNNYRVIRSDASKTTTIYSLAQDADLAHPMTILILLSEQEEAVPDEDAISV
jgi:hypothetical protein